MSPVDRLTTSKGRNLRGGGPDDQSNNPGRTLKRSKKNKKEEKGLFIPPSDASDASVRQSDFATECGIQDQVSISCGAGEWRKGVVQSCCSGYVCKGKRCESVYDTFEPTSDPAMYSTDEPTIDLTFDPILSPSIVPVPSFSAHTTATPATKAPTFHPTSRPTMARTTPSPTMLQVNSETASPTQFPVPAPVDTIFISSNTSDRDHSFANPSKDTTIVTTLTCTLIALICVALLCLIGRGGRKRKSNIRDQNWQVIMSNNRRTKAKGKKCKGKHSKSDSSTDDDNIDSGSVASMGSWFGKSIHITKGNNNEADEDDERDDDVSSIDGGSFTSWFYRSRGQGGASAIARHTVDNCGDDDDDDDVSSIGANLMSDDAKPNDASVDFGPNKAMMAQDEAERIERFCNLLDSNLGGLGTGKCQIISSGHQDIDDIDNTEATLSPIIEEEKEAPQDTGVSSDTGSAKEESLDSSTHISHISDLTNNTDINHIIDRWGNIEGDLEHYCSADKVRQWVQTREGYKAYCDKIIPLLPEDQQAKHRSFAKHYRAIGVASGRALRLNTTTPKTTESCEEKQGRTAESSQSSGDSTSTTIEWC